MTKTAFAALLQKTARAQRSARRLRSLQKCAQEVDTLFGGRMLGPRVYASHLNVRPASAKQAPRRDWRGLTGHLHYLNPTVAAATGRLANGVPAKAPVTQIRQARKPLTPGGVQATPRVSPLDDITNRLHKGFSQLKNDPKAYFGQLGKRFGFQ